MTKCEICGRTEQELEEEFSREISIKEHQSMNKCSKCFSEYQRETREEKTGSEEAKETKDWKKAITA